MEKTLEQIISTLKKDLAPFQAQAQQSLQKVQAVVTTEHKSKNLMLHKRRFYSLNPHREGRLIYEQTSKKKQKIVKKQDRKQARLVSVNLDRALQSLLLVRKLARQEKAEVQFIAARVIQDLEKMSKILTTLVTRPQEMINQAKLFRYQRREELALYAKIFGEGPAKSRRRKTRAPLKGDVSMSTKTEIQKLLTQLEKAKDATEKRNIRTQLRTLGHKGGLGKGRGRPPKKTKKTKKTNKKAEKSEKA